MIITSRIEKTVLVAMKGDGKGFLNSFKSNAMDLMKMNGTTDMMGMPSQGAQELAQKVDQNEKTGMIQNIADKVNQFLARPLMLDNTVIGPDGQRYNKDLIDQLGGFDMQELERRKKILSQDPPNTNPYGSLY